MIVNCRVMFHGIISAVVRPSVPIYSKLLNNLLIYEPMCHFIFHIFERFCFIPELTNTYVVELSVFRGVGGFLWSNAIKYGRIMIAVFPLLKVTNIPVSATEDIKLRIFFHYVWIGPFLLGVDFSRSGEGQLPR